MFPTPYKVFAVLTFGYTLYGISQLGKDGGPCNAGLAIIYYTPLLFVCSILIIWSLYRIKKKGVKDRSISIILSAFSLLIWVLAIPESIDDSHYKGIIYLCPFAFLQILSIFVIAKQKKPNGLK